MTISADRRSGEHDDAVREDEPVAEVRELPRDEAIAARAALRGAGSPGSDVFAASTRIAKVKIWTTQYMNDAALPAGERRPSDLGEHGSRSSSARACMCTASHETPRKRLIAIVPRTASVRAAFADWGRLNALTPLAIASTPVNADAPDEKARSSTKHTDRPGARGERMRDDRVWAGPDRAAGDARADRDVEGDDEAVRRDREEEPGLLDAAEVDERDQADRSERQLDAVRRER